MTPELTFTALAALLTAVMWVPYIVGVNAAPAEADAPDPFHRPPDPARQRPWVHRAHRAHLNQVETLAPHAALVLIAHAAGVSTPVTVWACGLYLALRLAHAVGMVTGTARFPLRPILFTAATLCTVAVGVEVLLVG